MDVCFLTARCAPQGLPLELGVLLPIQTPASQSLPRACGYHKLRPSPHPRKVALSGGAAPRFFFRISKCPTRAEGTGSGGWLPDPLPGFGPGLFWRVPAHRGRWAPHPHTPREGEIAPGTLCGALRPKYLRKTIITKGPDLGAPFPDPQKKGYTGMPPPTTKRGGLPSN